MSGFSEIVVPGSVCSSALCPKEEAFDAWGECSSNKNKVIKNSLLIIFIIAIYGASGKRGGF
jgi:hypothetical protein